MLKPLTNLPVRQGQRFYAPILLLLFFLSLSPHQQVNAQCACATGSASLDWDVLNWPIGSFNNNYDLQVTNSEVLNVEIDISTTSSGSFLNQFGYNWPQKDSVGGDPEFFGDKTDLALIFDPADMQGTSPVDIRIVFDQAVECVQFEISDIDISGTTRRDSITITSNAGIPTLTLLDPVNTTLAIYGNAASATGTGGTGNNGTSSKDDNGSISVDFGALKVDTIYITYSESSGVANPTGRGIGFFGSFSVCPPPIPGSIAGTVEADTDNNNSGDIPIPITTTLQLLDSDGNPVLDGGGLAISTTTAINGTYSFTDVEPGDYLVVEVNPSGYLSVSDTDGGDADTTAVTVGAAEDVTGINFVDEQSASIAGKVWEDTDGNGTGDIAGPFGTVINLLDGSGDPVLDSSGDPVRTTTIIDGTYSFSDIPPGNYQVEEVDATGFSSVSDTDGGDPGNTVVAVDAGDNITGIDFIDTQLASISGTVYEDTDGDGDGDVDLGSNITINLLDEFGDPVLDGGMAVTTLTDADGKYSFANLAAGNYQVEEVDPAEYASVGDTDAGDKNNTAVSVVAGDNITGINFIDERSARIRGFVWEDTDGNGSGDVAAPAGTLLILLDDMGNYVFDDDGDTLQVTTNSSGLYMFRDVPPGDYTVVEINPDDFVSVSDTDGGDPDSTSVSPTAGSVISNIDFVDEVAVDISGFVLHDADGLSDDTVDGIGIDTLDGFAQMITLYDNSFSFLRSAPINPDGSYAFTDVTPGSYIVQLNDPGASPSLPGVWVNTGETIGTGSGNDGLINGTQSITVSTIDLAQINFGIEQAPRADTLMESSQLNPGGTNQVVAPNLGGSDSEDGIYGTGDSLLIQQVPANADLYYNSVLLSNGTKIFNYSPALLMVDPVDGDVDVVFTYKTYDAAGETSPEASVTMPFRIVLPVELVDFVARKANNWSHLSWATASEQHSERFEVERSLDGKKFSLVGGLPAQGFSNTIVTYEFSDRQPAAGLNYYRLKQVNTDGTFEYSMLRVVDFGREVGLKIYPNPSGGMVFYNEEVAAARVELFASNGNLVKSVLKPEGRIDLDGLPEGWYLLRFLMEDGSSSIRRIKLMRE